jgi:dCMP deaminase
MGDNVTLAHSELGPGKDGRPSFESIYMRLAYALAERSTCRRLKVGTVITSTDFRKVLAVGYNGNASGLPNDCDRDEPGNCGCLHSEENAVINCDSPRYAEKLVFVTHLPCVMCAKRLINLGNVRRVYYAETYRLPDSLNVFEQGRIEVVRLLTAPEAPQRDLPLDRPPRGHGHDRPEHRDTQAASPRRSSGR